MTTALITHDACLGHLTPAGHPERVERLRAVLDALSGEKFPDLVRVEAPRIAEEALLRSHDAALVRGVLSLNIEPGQFARIDADTAMSSGSREAALRAAGAVTEAVDQVMAGHVGNAFCAVRPPGHHAERSRAMGFCLFNNVAVGVAHALANGLERAAVIDFDVHHGNGTEQIFAGDERVVMVGTFEYPLYPYSGVDPLGPNMHNVPLRAGSGGDAFRAAMNDVCLPALEAHRPEMLFISAGFDAHREDPLANLQFTEADYAWVTKELVALAARHAQGRIVSSLEGGYALSALGRSATEHLRALGGC